MFFDAPCQCNMCMLFWTPVQCISRICSGCSHVGMNAWINLVVWLMSMIKVEIWEWRMGMQMSYRL